MCVKKVNTVSEHKEPKYNTAKTIRYYNAIVDYVRANGLVELPEVMGYTI